MQKHRYRPFTTRDGSKACAECNGNEHAEQHQQEPLVHSETSYCSDLTCGQCNKRWKAVKQQVLAGETFTQDYDRGDGVFVDATVFLLMRRCDGKEFECFDGVLDANRVGEIGGKECTSLKQQPS